MAHLRAARVLATSWPVREDSGTRRPQTGAPTAPDAPASATCISCGGPCVVVRRGGQALPLRPRKRHAPAPPILARRASARRPRAHAGRAAPPPRACARAPRPRAPTCSCARRNRSGRGRGRARAPPARAGAADAACACAPPAPRAHGGRARAAWARRRSSAARPPLRAPLGRRSCAACTRRGFRAPEAAPWSAARSNGFSRPCVCSRWSQRAGRCLPHPQLARCGPDPRQSRPTSLLRVCPSLKLMAVGHGRARPHIDRMLATLFANATSGELCPECVECRQSWDFTSLSVSPYSFRNTCRSTACRLHRPAVAPPRWLGIACRDRPKSGLNHPKCGRSGPNQCGQSHPPFDGNRPDRPTFGRKCPQFCRNHPKFARSG